VVAGASNFASASMRGGKCPRPARRARGEGCPRELGYNEVWTPNVARLLRRLNEKASVYREEWAADAQEVPPRALSHWRRWHH
jgi:hypothetical protein